MFLNWVPEVELSPCHSLQQEAPEEEQNWFQGWRCWGWGSCWKASWWQSKGAVHRGPKLRKRSGVGIKIWSGDFNGWEFPLWLSRLQTQLVSMRMRVWTLALLSGLRMLSCAVVNHRCGSDPVLQWLWHRPVATALIQPLAREIFHLPQVGP